MDYSLIQSIWTVVVMVVFIGIVLWAWSGKRKERFDQAANIPFDDDAPMHADNNSKEKPDG